MIHRIHRTFFDNQTAQIFSNSFGKIKGSVEGVLIYHPPNPFVLFNSYHTWLAGGLAQLTGREVRECHVPK